jgi:hydrogenase expression/formation protein HypE
MTELGKVSGTTLTDLILRRLGAPDDGVLVAPGPGLDTGVWRVAPGVAIALTTDPVFVLPTLGWERAAWFAVHILASDAATSGLPLRGMTVDLNLPPEVGDAELDAIWSSFAGTCAELGITVLAGHTARYAGCSWPMVGGATCLALGPDDQYVTPAMARPGDLVLITKGAAIEATALLAVSFPEQLAAAGVGPAMLAAAQALVLAMTVVPEARAAADYGVRDRGVTAMHDATEGGVLSGLVEIADASGVGLRVDRELIPVRPEVAAVCAAAGIDPLAAISEGTLLATVRPVHADGVLAAIRGTGVEAVAIGEVVPAAAGRRLLVGGEPRPLQHPGLDPYWAAAARLAADR